LLVPWGQGSDAGSTLSLLILFRVSSGVGMLVVGGVVAEVRAGHDTAKKKTHSLREGKAREGSTLGCMGSETGGMQEEKCACAGYLCTRTGLYEGGKEMLVVHRFE